MIRRAFVVTPLTAILGLLVADRILAPSGDFLSDDTWQIIGLILAFSGTIVLLFIGGAHGQSIHLTGAAVCVGIGVALLLDFYFL